MLTKNMITMKRVQLSDLPDASALSWVLDQALYLLANSPLQYRASRLSQAIGLHASVLTRMKLLHNNPDYAPLVSEYQLLHVVKFLFEQFPTLALRQARDGRIVVHLYKRYNGYKLEDTPLDVPPPPLFRPKAPRPGTTRWFLQQYAPAQPGSAPLRAGGQYGRKSFPKI